MFVDGSKFPIVRMHNSGHPVEQTFEEISDAWERVLERQEPFVLISYGTDRPKMSTDKAENRRVASWIKTNRPRFGCCLTMLIVEQSAVKRIAVGSAISLLAKFWGFSVSVVPSEDAAIKAAEDVLARSGARVGSPARS